MEAESIGLEPAVTTEAVPSASGFSIDVPDLDDLGVLLVVPALLLGGILAALYVVYAAPVLLAEVLVDVLLVSGLESPHSKPRDGIYLDIAAIVREQRTTGRRSCPKIYESSVSIAPA